MIPKQKGTKITAESMLACDCTATGEPDAKLLRCNYKQVWPAWYFWIAKRLEYNIPQFRSFTGDQKGNITSRGTKRRNTNS